jgi:hypothetical protein
MALDTAVTAFWDVAPPGLVVLALVVESASFSETSVALYRTARRGIPEDSPLHIPALCNEQVLGSLFVGVAFVQHYHVPF